MNKLFKRIFAILLIVILVGLYVVAFIAALLSKPESTGLFNAALASTVILPTLIYVYMWFANVLKKSSNSKNIEKQETDNNN